MRKLGLTAVLVLVMIANTFGQSVNGVELKDLTAEYLQIVGRGKMFSNKVSITLDYGQEIKLSGKEGVVKRFDGKLYILNSMVDALNLLESYGYEYLDSNFYTVGNSQVVHFMLKKK